MVPHEMIVVKSGESGSEEWDCPSCGRRLLLRWPPRFERIVLLPGDERALHVGGRNETPTTELTAPERMWLSEHGIVWE